MNKKDQEFMVKEFRDIRERLRIYDKYTTKHLSMINGVVWFIGYWTVGMISVFMGKYILALFLFGIGLIMVWGFNK